MRQYRPDFRGRTDRYPVKRPSIRQLTHEEISNPRRRHPIRLLCADWTDPRNVGSVFRLADAAGLEEVVLAGTTPRPPNRKLSRTARSTEKWIPYRQVADPVSFLRAEARNGTEVIALEITDESKNLFTAPVRAPLILVVGSESAGVAPELLDCCSRSLHLPMHGRNTSMNVAVALGAAVYLLLMKLQ